MVLALDLKITYAGGKRYIPIALDASQKAGETKYDESQIYNKQYDPFFKTDVKLSFRMNGRKVSHEYQFYVENVTNHKNMLVQMYSVSKNKIVNGYQLGFFPMILYRMTF